MTDRFHDFINGSPYLEALVAQVYAIAGHADEAVALVTKSLRKIRNNRGRWFEAELHRFRAEWLLHSADRNRDEAEVALLEALRIARAQGAKMWELRAAASLALLWGEQGERRKGFELLAPIYDWFSKDFETPDFKNARLLLASLS